MAHYFLNCGYSKGGSIAIFMENRPEYVATWLGLAKIGIIPALINYNLKGTSLTHAISAANCSGKEGNVFKRESERVMTTTLTMLY